MKLKPIVAALALLVSGNAFAAYHPVESKTDFLQAKLDRNANPFYAESDWFKRICFSGLVQVYAMATTDAVYYRPQDASTSTNVSFNGLFGSGTKESTDLWLSRANFYIDADVNDWTQVHMAFDFSNFAAIAVEGNTSSYPNLGHLGTASHMYMHYDERSYLGSNTNVFPTPDEAVINIGNFAKSQFYMQAGRKYLRFGHYVRNVTPMTLTQMVSQTLADTVEIGFVDISNFNASFAIFRSASRATSSEHNINNFVAQLGYVYENGDFSADMSVDYMYDVSAVNFIGAPGAHPAIANMNGGGVGVGGDDARVGGLVITALVDWQAFDFMGQIFFTDDDFAMAALTYNGAAAEPCVWMIQGGYRFGIFNNDDSHVALNFQMTHEALGMNLPKYRVQGTFTHEYAKNTEVSLALVYDHDYSRGNSGKSTLNSTVNGTDDDTFTALLGLTARVA